MEHTPVAEAPAMEVAPQSEMADASQTEVAVSGPIETPEIEVFDNQHSQQSIAQEQERAFSSPKKHSAKMEKKSSKKLAKFSKKDKKGKKLAIAKKEKLAKGSKAKKGMVAKSSKSKKIVKGKSSKSKVVSSKSKKGKKDRKVASSK
ncbi:hypothetical protein D3C86_1705500 [compost metagenome]